MKAFREARQKQNLQHFLNHDVWMHYIYAITEDAPVAPKDSGHFGDEERGVVQHRISVSSAVVTAGHSQLKTG